MKGQFGKKLLWCARTASVGNLVSRKLIRSNFYPEEMMKLTFQALAIRLQSDEGLTLKTSVSYSFHVGTFTFIDLFNAKF